MPSEKKVKLTKRVVESTNSDPVKRVLVWDSEIRGFHLRIYPTGRKVYYFQYRNKHRATKKVNIGIHGNISTEQARDAAQWLALDVSTGKDPASQKHSRKSLPSMAELCHEYLELHAKVSKRSKSSRNDMTMINDTILPVLGNKKLEEVSSHDLQKLHKDLQATPYKANRIRSLLSKMFNLSIEWGWHSENPAKHIKKYHEEKRTRWLDEVEIERLLNVLENYQNPAISVAIKLLILTGARKSEVLSAQWIQFDLERGVWTKPAHTTKQKREEHLPLSSVVIDLLKDWRRCNPSLFLFPGKSEGQPLQDIKKAWSTIRSAAGLDDVRIHDLRHTYASHLVSSGMSLSIVGKLLGHTQAATTQRYAHLADEPLRQATELFGSKISNKDKPIAINR